ncbi:MAG: hypothetical protein EPN57_00620 [Paraburkholderia sp.]|nr:MAG: hypothetical protein EPN57_00620 [Paraburkholderia sp.]
MSRDRASAGHRRQRAAARLVQCYETLAKRNENLLQHVVGDSAFECWRRYPCDDVIDPRSGFQYFYHAHSPDDRPDAIENGHFHTFARLDHRTRRVDDWPVPPLAQGGKSEWDPTSVHLVAVSVDAHGLPTDIFTVNQWVTGDRWCDDASVARLASAFDVDGARPALVSAWLGSIFALYEAEIRGLIRDRGKRVQALIASHGPDYRITDDRAVEMLSARPLSFSADVEAALRPMRRVPTSRL